MITSDKNDHMTKQARDQPFVKSNQLNKILVKKLPSRVLKRSWIQGVAESAKYKSSQKDNKSKV